MLKNFLNQPNVIGRLMIALLFVGGVVYAGAFNGFVIETQASSCCGETNTCGGGTDALIFSSSECCEEDKCGLCGCNIAGCSDCLDSMLSCGSDKDGNSCKCGQDGGGGIGGNAADSCSSECASGTDKKNVCENNCGF